MTAPQNSFSKKQRLKSRKKLQQLFVAKKSVSAGSVKIMYFIEEGEPGIVKCGVGTSGRYFKKAVDRNRVKRLLREAFRLQQQELNLLVRTCKKEAAVFLLYTGQALPDYPTVYKNVEAALQKLLEVEALRVKPMGGVAE